MANHSSVFAWRIPWTEVSGGLQSMRSQRVRHDWVNLTHWEIIHMPHLHVLGLICISLMTNNQSDKASACNAGDLGLIPGSGRFPWRRKWQPTPVFLPGESHGWRSLVGYSPRGRKESDTTEWLHFHFQWLIINLISVLTIWWCPCVESSLVLLEEGVCYDQCILLAKLY